MIYKEGYKTHKKHYKKQQIFKASKKKNVNSYRGGYLLTEDGRLIRVYRYRSSEPEYKSGRRTRLNQSWKKEENVRQLSRLSWLYY